MDTSSQIKLPLDDVKALAALAEKAVLAYELDDSIGGPDTSEFEEAATPDVVLGLCRAYLHSAEQPNSFASELSDKAGVLRGAVKGESNAHVRIVASQVADFLDLLARRCAEQAQGRVEPTDEQIVTLCKVFLAGTYGGFDHKPNERAIDAMRSAVECAFSAR